MRSAENTRSNWFPASLLFAIGAIFSIALGFALSMNAQSKRSVSFENHVDRKTAELQRIVNEYTICLRNTASMITALGHENLSPELFRTYVETLGIRENFRGALGLGFVRKVSIEDEASFIQEMRQQGLDDFDVQFISPSTQDRFVMQYIEPALDNKSAQGLDLGSESIRRENALSAFSRAGLAVSKPVTMIQNSSVGRMGFTMLMPAFSTTQPSKDLGARYEELIGWVSFPVSIDRFLGTWLEDGRQLPVRVSVLDTNEEPQLFLDNMATRSAKLLDDAFARRVIQLGNRRWQVDYWPARPEHTSHRDWIYWIVSLLGMALSILVALRVKTGLDRRSAQILFEQLVDTSSDALVAEDAKGHILVWNKSAERLFGHDKNSVLNDMEQHLTVPSELISAEKRLRQRAAEGEHLMDIPTQRINDAAKTIHLRMNLSPVFSTSKQLLGFTRSYRDETETRQAWRDINALEELLSHAPDGVVLLDKIRRIKQINPAGLLLLQGTELNSTLIGQRIADLLGPEALIQFENEVLQPLYKNNRVEAVFNWPLPNNLEHVSLFFRGLILSSAETDDPVWALRFDKKKHIVHRID